MRKTNKRIGEIFMEKGLITEAQLYDALAAQKSGNGFLGTVLMGKGIITEEQLTQVLSEQFGMPVVDIKKQYVDTALARKFSSSLILDHKCFPLSEDENSITVAIANPLNAVAISKVEEEAGQGQRKVNWVLASEADLKELIQDYRRNISQNIQNLLKRNKT